MKPEDKLYHWTTDDFFFLDDPNFNDENISKARTAEFDALREITFDDINISRTRMR